MLTFSSTRAVDIDSGFKADFPYGTIHSVATAPDGSILAAGEFSTLNGQRVQSVVKLSADGALNSTFVSPDLGGVFATTVAADGTPYTGGSGGLAAVQSDGSVRTLLSPTAVNGRINAVALTNGKLLIGGNFWSQPDAFVSRLNIDGTLDASFKSGLKLNFSMEAGVNAVAVQSDGKVIVGGNFDTDAGFTTVARLNVDGSVDATFSHANGTMLYPKAIALLSDGKILVSGVRDSSGAGFVRRLNPDGSVDGSFSEPVLDGAVETMVVDENGQILAGGSFTHVNGVAQARLTRLGANGQATDWTMGANNVVKALALDANGNVLVGGAFSQIGGVAQSGLVRLVHLEGVQSEASSNTLHFSLTAGTDGVYAIESSTDLKTWTDTGRRSTTATGLNVAVDPNVGARLFLRARLIQ